MKIVINSCYGGFSLSREAVKLLAAKNGRECYFCGSRKRYCSTTCKDSDRDPVKLASRLALKTAVNRGEIVRPDSCQRCGKREALIEGHHHDYAKPLDVQWLCPKCHAATHMEMRANGQNI